MNSRSFTNRLIQLRTSRGVSARSMSLSLEQGAGYISNIENGVNLPSMNGFFRICDYLNVTPREFFEADVPGEEKYDEILEYVKVLNSDQLHVLTDLAKALKDRQPH